MRWMEPWKEVSTQISSNCRTLGDNLQGVQLQEMEVALLSLSRFPRKAEGMQYGLLSNELAGKTCPDGLQFYLQA